MITNGRVKELRRLLGLGRTLGDSARMVEMNVLADSLLFCGHPQCRNVGSDNRRKVQRNLLDWPIPPFDQQKLAHNHIGKPAIGCGSEGDGPCIHCSFAAFGVWPISFRWRAMARFKMIEISQRTGHAAVDLAFISNERKTFVSLPTRWNSHVSMKPVAKLERGGEKSCM